MRQITSNDIKRLLLVFAAITFSVRPIAADDNEKHELENMHVTIQASEYKSCKFLDKEIIKGKEYIFGKASSYKKNGEANAGTLLQPYAEYAIKSKMPGGTYNITVFYTIDKETVPENPQIAIGINTQKPQHIEIKNKLINSVKASFKVNFFKGKTHTVKVWFPSQGVKVREIKIAKAILPKKA